MINKIYSMFGLCMKSGNIAFGRDMCEENVKKKRAKLLVVAKDCSENTIEKFKKLCEQFNVKCIEFGTLEEISRSIGKTNKAVIAILDDGFARKIEEMLKEIKGANI